MVKYWHKTQNKLYNFNIMPFVTIKVTLAGILENIPAGVIISICPLQKAEYFCGRCCDKAKDYSDNRGNEER